MLDVEELLRALHQTEVRFIIVGGMAAVVHGSSYVTLTTRAGDLDLFGEITGLGDFAQVKEQAEPIALYGYTTWVLSLEGLIASKEASARAKDQRLLPELRALLQLRREEKQASDGSEGDQTV